MKLWPFGRRKAVCVPHEVLPIPVCLRPFLVPDDRRCSMTEVAGSIRCTCGHETFTAHRSVDDDRLYHLICKDCGQDVVLFDAHQHGWGSLVCGNPVEDAQAGEHTERCARCGNAGFYVSVWLEPCDRDEFVQDVPDGLTEERWVNAFTFFGASLTCSRCGRRERSWADIETD